MGVERFNAVPTPAKPVVTSSAAAGQLTSPASAFNAIPPSPAPRLMILRYHSRMERPTLAITMGDPCGVGPETIVGAWSDPEFHRQCRAVVVGHPEILRRAVSVKRLAIVVQEVASPAEACPSPTALPCLAAVRDDALAAPVCTIDARGGQAAYDCLRCATRLALEGRVDGITTAPLNKAALWAAGHKYPGHTELLGELCGVDDVAMMLYLPPGERVLGPAGLGVVHVTLHTSVRSVPDRLTTADIVTKTRLVDDVMRAWTRSGDRPRIAVCALNPHAGEQGLFGDEEIRLIEPAVRQAREEGLAVDGPLPADTLFVRAAAGDFDAVVAMYHDQGHIALKLLDMYRAVNVTLGLPIVRTSVAHGTAFDLAWTGRADTRGMRQAIRVAAELVRARRA